jgi:hypothetical protein
MLVPLPDEAKVTLPGSARASASSSATEFAFTDGCTTSTLDSETSADTGSRSLIGSNGISAYGAELMR